MAASFDLLNIGITPEGTVSLAATDLSPSGAIAEQTVSGRLVADRFKIGLLAADPNTPSQQLRLIAESKSHSLRLTVAQNPSVHPDTLDWLARRKNEHPDVLKIIAEHPATHHKTLKHLLKTRKAWYLLKAVCERDDLTTEFFRQMRVVRWEYFFYIARNPRTHSAILEYFLDTAHIMDSDKRKTLARNANTPESALRRLAERHPDTHETLAANGNTPTDLLHDLGVREAATENTRIQLVINKNTNHRTLNILSSDPHPRVRSLVATNPRTPRATVVLLGMDLEPSVRQYAVAALDGAFGDTFPDELIYVWDVD